MTLTQMQYFQAVCKYENFTKAAEDQHISQPAMSAAMKELEAECGVPLFKKTRNSLTITDAGWALLEEVEKNLTQYDHLMYAVKNLSLSRKYIRVGVSTLNGNLVYPQILSAFKKHYPDIQVISSEESTPQQFELLSQGKLDVIINGRKNVHPDGSEVDPFPLASWPLVDNEMVFCVWRDHPLAKKDSVTLEEIAREPLVLLSPHFSLTQAIERRLKGAGLSYNVLHYTDQMYSVERFTEQGVACGFLPKVVVEQNPCLLGSSCPALPHGWVYLHWRDDRSLFPTVKTFIRFVKEMYPKQ